MSKAQDLSGLKFGRLTAIEKTDRRSSSFVVWKCLCECGQYAFVGSGNLKNGHTRSCGCLLLDTVTKHGSARDSGPTKEYSAWAEMRQRCGNPNNPSFPRYGARGIKVCERWTKFENFSEDMGPCPPGLTLERIDSDKGYEPSNCKWATYGEQNRNTSQTRKFTMNGETLCMQDWCYRTGLSRNTVNGRLRRGWTAERTFNEPSNSHRKAS